MSNQPTAPRYRRPLPVVSSTARTPVTDVLAELEGALGELDLATLFSGILLNKEIAVIWDSPADPELIDSDDPSDYDILVSSTVRGVTAGYDQTDQTVIVNGFDAITYHIELDTAVTTGIIAW